MICCGDVGMYGLLCVVFLLLSVFCMLSLSDMVFVLVLMVSGVIVIECECLVGMMCVVLL